MWSASVENSKLVDNGVEGLERVDVTFSNISIRVDGGGILDCVVRGECAVVGAVPTGVSLSVSLIIVVVRTMNKNNENTLK